MKKLNSEQRLIVEEHRKEITALQTKRDEIYEDMLSKLGEVEEPTEDWIFDYVYNCSVSSSEEYLKFVEEKLFE